MMTKIPTKFQSSVSYLLLRNCFVRSLLLFLCKYTHLFYYFNNVPKTFHILLNKKYADGCLKNNVPKTFHILLRSMLMVGKCDILKEFYDTRLTHHERKTYIEGQLVAQSLLVLIKFILFIQPSASNRT